MKMTDSNLHNSAFIIETTADASFIEIEEFTNALEANDYTVKHYPNQSKIYVK
jgi:hypothetical protein